MSKEYDYLTETMHDQDIHPESGEYAPNHSQILHVLEVLTEMFDVGIIQDSRDIMNLASELSEKIEEEEIVRKSITHLTDWGRENNIVHQY